MFGRPLWQWILAVPVLTLITMTGIPVIYTIANLGTVVCLVIALLGIIRAIFTSGDSGKRPPGYDNGTGSNTAGHDRALRRRDGGIG